MVKVVAAIVFVLLAGKDSDKPPLNYTKVCLPGSRGEKSAR